MAKSIDEAIAWLQHTTQGKGAVHYEAVLGAGNVPEMSHFASNNEEDLAKCSDFLEEVEENISCLKALLEQRSGTVKKAREIEAANTIPGIPPAEPEIPAEPVRGRRVKQKATAPEEPPQALSVEEAEQQLHSEPEPEPARKRGRPSKREQLEAQHLQEPELEPELPDLEFEPGPEPVPFEEFVAPAKPQLGPNARRALAAQPPTPAPPQPPARPNLSRVPAPPAPPPRGRRI